MSDIKIAVDRYPTPWIVEYMENGGYDCMSDAWYVRDARGNTVVDIDESPIGREMAEALAKLICQTRNESGL